MARKTVTLFGQGVSQAEFSYGCRDETTQGCREERGHVMMEADPGAEAPGPRQLEGAGPVLLQPLRREGARPC